MRIEIGDDVFDAMLTACRTEFGIERSKDAIKSPAVLTEVLRRAEAQGKTSGTLQNIVEKSSRVDTPAPKVKAATEAQ